VFGLDRLRGQSDDQSGKNYGRASISPPALSDHSGVNLRDLSFNSICRQCIDAAGILRRPDIMERIFLDAASDVCVSTQSFVVYFDEYVEPIDIEADQEIIKIVDDEMGPLAPCALSARWRHQL